MTGFDRAGWEARWAQALEQHGDRLAERPPNPHFLAEAADLPPGRALDAGCGHGAETLWLAGHGWEVTAVDFSATALDHARSSARALGLDGIDWVEGDLGTWAPERDSYDLVVCLYVHVAASAEAMVRRLAAGVAPGGTLLLAGTVAPGQRQVSLADARAVLSSDDWEVVVAEERPRSHGGGGTDAVVRAQRRA